MRPAPLAPPSPGAAAACTACTDAVRRSDTTLRAFANGHRDRAVYVGCGCDGRALTPLWQHRAAVPMPAASLAKLPWTLAAIRAHHDGALDLTTPLPAQTIADSRYRDGLAALTPHAPLPWASLIGLGLVTSANPVFDHLTRTPGLRERAHATSDGVTLTSGFSDEDLDGPIYDNTMTAASSAATLLAVLREARDDLQPISWGLINSARTTRLVRDLDNAPKRGDGFYSANKTGTLTRIRNDVAALIDGEHVLVIAALTCHQPTTHDVDHAMAGLGAQLAAARYGN